MANKYSQVVLAVFVTGLNYGGGLNAGQACLTL